MKKENFHHKTAAFLLSFGLVLSQIPAYAADEGTAAKGASEQLAAGVDPTPSAPAVRIKATEEVNSPVLSGTITTNVENLTKGILKDEVALQKFNLQFRINAAKQGRWKGWRYFVAQNGNLMATDAGLITAVANRYDHIHGLENIKRASRNINANGGVVPGLCGQGVAFGGSFLELGINQWHSADAKKRGYGFNESRDKAIRLVADIDKKMAERERLIKEQPAADKEQADMQELEGKVLQDFRDSAIAEFERYHVGARKTLAQQNSFYVCDMFLNKTPGIIGSSLGIHDILGGKAFAGFDVPTGILTLISGAFIAANPVISRVYAKGVEKHDKKNLEKHGLPTIWENADKLETDWGRMQSYCTNHQIKDRPDCQALVVRLAAFDANHKFVTDELQRNAKALRRGNRTAIQNMGVGSLIGASKMTFGILAINSGANYLHDSVRRFNMFSAGNLEYLPAVSYGVVDNWRIQVTNEIRRANQKKAGTLPGQLIKGRLEELNKIEKSI